jgi:MATE family multidrug resistance protein
MNPFDKQILSLALPSILQNITVPLLGLVDLTIVGHLGSTSALGAIAVGTTVFNVVYWLLGFLRMGTSGLTSQAYGRENIVDVVSLRNRSLKIALAIGFLLVVFQVPLLWAAMAVIHPSASVVPLARLYCSICIWGAPAVLGLFCLNGWFIGLQDTRTPLYVAVAQNLINIAASLTFVYALRLDIAGVAMGTLVAQWSGFLFSMWVAIRRAKALWASQNPTERPARGHRTGWMVFFKVNRDIFLRTLFLVVVNLAFTSIGARQGEVVLSVNALLFTFYTLFSYFMDGFAFAAEALCGNFYGGGNREAFSTVVRRLFTWGWAMVGIFTLVYLLGGQPLLHLLTSDTEVLALAPTYFYWVLLIPIAGVGAFIYDGVFIGITATRGMLASSFLAAVFFFAIYFLGTFSGLAANHLLWGAFIVYLFVRGVVEWAWMRRTTLFAH